MAVSDYLLICKGPEVKGESQDDKYPESIEVHGFSWSGHNASTHRHGSGGGKGQVSHGDLQIQRLFDKASIAIFDKLNCGDHVKEVTLIIRKKTGEEGKPLEYLKLKLEKATVSAHSVSGQNGGDVHESLTLAYEQMKWEYTEQKADGTKGAVVGAGWNHATHKRLG